MNVKNITPKKNKAQAMVEFAIVLPMLLLLLYGILEAGRLLFIYSTVVTASRQAVRYGSATGQGLDYTSQGGPDNSGLPRYQDCYGIRLAAQRVDFLNAFNDDDIIIQYDNGPASSPTTFCDGSTNNFDPAGNSQRLLVTIDGDYLPIVPRIVGFLERSDANTPPNPIQAQSARTVLVSVSIFVTAPTQPFVAITSTNTLTPTAGTPTNTPSSTPTATATLTPLVSNTPSVTPSPSRTATVTLSPTVTLTRTPSLTPTLTPTNVPSCNTTHSTINLPEDNTMTMTITNPNAWPLSIQDVFVVWDHDRGHQTGNDKTLRLQSVSLGGTPLWSGDLDGPTALLTPTAPLSIPPGGSITIVFTFHQAYDRSDGSEEININLSTPGCESFPIHEKR
jgi:hypothetical protein